MPPIVDIHCHMFNADDLPVEGFVKARGVPDVVAEMIAKILQGGTPPEESKLPDISILEPSGVVIDDTVKKMIDEHESIRKDLQENFVPFDSKHNYSKIQEIRRYVRWAIVMTNTRKGLKEIYFKKFPQIDLAIALMMDMENWLGDKPEVSFEKQVDLIAGLIRQSQGKLHAFIAFDPERGRTNNKIFDLIREAMDRGFMGVKLYPPMGYVPADNSFIPNPKPYANDYDKVFDQLFRMCSDERIPITTHSSNGGAEAYKGSGRLAHPAFWEPVLKKYNSLIVNFAHFGGADDLANNFRSSWAWKIAELMNRYENVYTDTGHHCELADPKINERYFANLYKMVEEYPVVIDRLMYGSDWHLIERMPDPEKYLEMLSHYYLHVSKFSEEECKKIFGMNALKFLGLGEYSVKNRLERFYTGNKLPDWVNAL